MILAGSPGAWSSIVQYSTVQHSAAQHSTVQYSPVQYSTALCPPRTAEQQAEPPALPPLPPADGPGPHLQVVAGQTLHRCSQNIVIC